METNFLLPLGVWMTNCFEPYMWDTQDTAASSTRWAWDHELCCLHVIQLLADRKGSAKHNTEEGKHIYPAHLTNTQSASYWIPQYGRNPF